MSKKHLWVVGGGTIILVAVAAIAHLVGKHTRPPATETNRFVRVIPLAERQRKEASTVGGRQGNC
jgi:hypothetical protein